MGGGEGTNVLTKLLACKSISFLFLLDVSFFFFSDTNIDPSLHERQRLLKKARLTDSLNDKLSHRPGVLELVQGNILQTDGKLHQLIKGNVKMLLRTAVHLFRDKE